MAVDPSGITSEAILNPFSNVSWFGMSTFATVFLIIGVAILFIGITIGITLWVINSKKYKFSIPLTKKVGNNTIKVGTPKAKAVKLGRGGDFLWFVKAPYKKWILPPTLQSGPNEFTHHIRSDGEWQNVSYPDVDEHLSEMKVKFVDQNLNANRIAVGELLENRFTDKGWWDKYGHLVTQVVFYLIVAIAMVIIFYQYSGVVTQTEQLISRVGYWTEVVLNESNGRNSLVPAFIPLLFFWRRRR